MTRKQLGDLLPVAVAFVLAGLFFSVLYLLYGLPGQLVAYGWLLALSAALVYLGLEVYRRGQRYRALERALAASQLTGFRALPEARCAEADLFRAHLATLGDQAFERENFLRQGALDREDSFALWVHQIKTPIAAMRLLLDNIRSSANVEQSEGLMEQSEGLLMELFKIEQYVELALHMERLDAPSKDLVLESVDLSKIARGAVRKLRTLFIGKGLSLALDLPESGPILISDEKWLSVAIEQILGNAVKYTSVGGVRLAVTGPYAKDTLPETARSWDQGYCLQVTDTGIGIAAEDLPRVFEKGYTGYHGRFDMRATGLGLYITQRALQQVGAQIQIASTVGQGTTVSLWLPLNHQNEHSLY